MYNILSQMISMSVTEGLAFTTKNIGEALLCSGAGMIGIFLVVGIIVLSVSILNKATSDSNKK